ncbi:GlxA family transcriptional regulator [Photobacterium galatheae]|uniref:AraC family transcriptional regulator n=1 Tax=Photobacterium galatheae TaxID=1654360 RepID=A0A066RK95_9GAMM|nr:helix-turn-helix domain-containing protein [Photobacterium galatheae]KDM90734.1 AraC family transcriptional regulator [Photobacterium galatheae]MCM0149936.1 helix-turn-helix domain-containing protein [Photobacterium galatheae]
MNIAFVLYPRALITGISLAAEMLTSAGGLRPRHIQKSQPVTISVVASSLSPPELKSGLRIQPDMTLDCASEFDFIILPPIWGNPVSVLKQSPALIPWLTQQYKQGAKIIATGTGVCWLAETGLLDHQVATTHWYYYDKFAARYPQITLNRQASITVANGLYCTVSINSQSELILYLIREHFGQSVAKTVETHFGHEISQSDQQPFYQIGGEVQFDESIALAQDWLKRNLALPVTAKDIAEQCGLPLRTFQRRFKTQVGQTPHEYLQSLRMEAAQSLLRDFGLSLQDVAEQVGYRDAHHFSTRFQKQFSLSPAQYRNMVKAKIYQA